MVLDEIRQALAIEDGQSVVEAVKVLVAQKREEQLPKVEALSPKSSPNQYQTFSAEEKQRIMDLVNRFDIPVIPKDSFRYRISKLVNSDITEMLEEDDYDFILQMRKRVTKST